LARSAWPGRSSFGKAARPGTSASVTMAAMRMPAESTSRWRLRPSPFLAPSNPRGPATGDALTDEQLTTAADGLRRRPERVRTSARTTVSTLIQVLLRHQRRKCLCVADQRTVKSWGRCGLRTRWATHRGWHRGTGASARADRTAHRVDVWARGSGRSWPRRCRIGRSCSAVDGDRVVGHLAVGQGFVGVLWDAYR
jgi:hypothetical protein